LISDDIYLDLQFTSFTSGGDFVYQRSTPAVAPNGDYNHNNVVDAGDYVVWRKTFGDPASPLGSGADGDGSGAIGPGDYTFWRERFGNVVGTGTLTAAVPEPFGLPLSLELVAVLVCLSRLRTFRGCYRRDDR
jgi:hypothetical protein